MTYYETFPIDTPKDKRRQHGVGDIFANQVECLKCGDLIRSKHRHDFVWCSCRSVAVDGGSQYGRIVGERENWADRSIPYLDV